MKTVYAHALAFGMMTGICFVAFSGLVLFLPFISAFILWDLTPVTFGWSTTLLWARLIFVVSALIGINFTFSKDGQGMVKDIVNG